MGTAQRTKPSPSKKAFATLSLDTDRVANAFLGTTRAKLRVVHTKNVVIYEYDEGHEGLPLDLEGVVMTALRKLHHHSCQTSYSASSAFVPCIVLSGLHTHSRAPPSIHPGDPSRYTSCLGDVLTKLLPGCLLFLRPRRNSMAFRVQPAFHSKVNSKTIDLLENSKEKTYLPYVACYIVF